MEIDNELGPESAVPAPKPVKPTRKQLDVGLLAELGEAPPKIGRPTKFSATKWKAAELQWRSCRSFVEVARTLGCTASAVSRMAARKKWLERLGQASVTIQRESQASIVARVTEQLARLDSSDKAALAAAIRQDHLRVGRELLTLGRQALERCPIDRPQDALRLIELAVKIEREAIEGNGDAASLTLTLRQQLDKFSVKPQQQKVTVTPAEPQEGDS